MKSMVFLLMLTIVTGIAVTGVNAQFLPENHYLVYNVFADHQYTAPIFLFDQFDIFPVDVLDLDKFANPVMKNNEPIFADFMHQTWWIIDDPEPGWLVALENQFGRQDWYVGDGRYLVLPALKNEPGQPPPWNHYKCYEAEGPQVDWPVNLADQYVIFTTLATIPELFCNPCAKDHFGIFYEIVDPEIHLACYRLEQQASAGFLPIAYDQFGEWIIEVVETCWLCVPSLKLAAIGTKETTWGKVKTMYHD